MYTPNTHIKTPLAHLQPHTSSMLEVFHGKQNTMACKGSGHVQMVFLIHIGHEMGSKINCHPLKHKKFLHSSYNNVQHDSKCNCDELTVYIIPCIVNMCIASPAFHQKHTNIIPYFTLNNTKTKFYDLHELTL